MYDFVAYGTAKLQAVKDNIQKRCSLEPKKFGTARRGFLQSCYIEIEQGFTKFTFSAAISKPLELEKSYIHYGTLI